MSRSPWLAVDPVSDRLAHARALRRMHEAFQSGEDVGRGVRAVVAQSWRRSGDAGIDPAAHLAPILLDEAAIAERWEAHPLYPVLPVLRDLLTDATTQSAHMLVISDAAGVLLWIEGHQRVIAATEDMHLVCGADWGEGGAGTNALGTAIAADHPVQIFSAEHFNRMVHPWQCSGAPIHDPDTGAILGVIDLTGHLKTAHPHTLSLVTAAAGMAEAYLRHDALQRQERLRERYRDRTAQTMQATALVGPAGRVLAADPSRWLREDVRPPAQGGELTLRDGTRVVAEPLGSGFILWRQPAARVAAARVPLRIELLGRRPRAIVDGRGIELTPRRAEILALLALSPAGLTAEQLALELYGDAGKPVSIRAELSRLRRVLGPALEARPYRLRTPVQADFAEAEELARGGRVGELLAGDASPLLPASEAPMIVEARDRLEGTLRHAVLAAGDAALLERWRASAWGREDLDAAERLLELLPAQDPRRPAAAAHAARLRRLLVIEHDGAPRPW